MTNESRVERLERAFGLAEGGGKPPVDVFIPDNGRDPDLTSRDGVICYDPNDVPVEQGEREAFFRELRGERQGVVTFLAVKT